MVSSTKHRRRGAPHPCEPHSPAPNLSIRVPVHKPHVLQLIRSPGPCSVCVCSQTCSACTWYPCGAMHQVHATQHPHKRSACLRHPLDVCDPESRGSQWLLGRLRAPPGGVRVQHLHRTGRACRTVRWRAGSQITMSLPSLCMGQSALTRKLRDAPMCACDRGFRVIRTCTAGTQACRCLSGQVLSCPTGPSMSPDKQTGCHMGDENHPSLLVELEARICCHAGSTGLQRASQGSCHDRSHL